MIAVLETDAALEAIAPEWEALWRRTPGATPFQSPSWLLPWWRQFGTGMARVGVWRRGGALEGVLPLYVLEEDGARKLLPIGAGTTDYLDALGDPAPLLAPVLERARQDGITHCDLFDVPPGSALLDLPAPPGWRAEWAGGNPCPVLVFPDIPARIRRKLRMSRHRADRMGGWAAEAAGPETVQAMLAELIRLHQARWTAQGETGTLASDPVLAFHRQAAPGLLAAGRLRLQVLRVAGEVVAAILALLAPGRIFFYLSGFDERHAFVSPGTLLLGSMLEEAMAEGRAEAHFLRGREAYKYAWGGVDRLNMTCRLTPAVSAGT
ncbi:MAG TPA: GNAT family N-acetyltransferase [Acetobacteraceae bacterium]|nr:GNAT family N-acetyltransferase [Acetobacteraceae bacterium]